MRVLLAEWADRRRFEATVQRIFDKHSIKSPQARDEIALELARRVKHG